MDKCFAPKRVRQLLLAAGLGLAVAGPLQGGTPVGIAGLSFASRSVARGGTMYTPMSPAETGIVTDNRYSELMMWGERSQEFVLGSVGTGVAIADYDLDGRPDLFVNSKTDGSRLFRNLGNWRFADVTERAGLGAVSVPGQANGGLPWMKRPAGDADEDGPGNWRQGATFADVNNDGYPDIYVCRYASPNLLYINQRDGTFKEEAEARGLAVADACGMGAFCDYDRDGWLDVYLQTNMLDATAHPNGQRGYLFRNNGDGTFTDVTRSAGVYGETLSHSCTWWDYDEDGWPDLYVANDFGPPDRLYRNNGDGTLSDVIHQVLPRMPYSSMGADLGDVNNDGHIDFLVADMATRTHEKDQRAMASARELTREDTDHPDAAPQFPVNALYVNTGTGRCLEAARLAGIGATNWTWAVRFEDLDNDGLLDLFVTNGMVREYHNDDLRQRVVQANTSAERTQVMRMSAKLEEKHLAFRNRGDLQFEEIGAQWGLDQTGVAFGAAFADLDGDGDLDLVYSNFESGVTVLRNDCASGHSVEIELRGTVSNRFGVGATVRLETQAGPQVRQLVLARGYLSSSEPMLHFGLGAEAQIARLVVQWPSGKTQTFNNLAVDRRYTITEPEGLVTPPKQVVPAERGQFTEVGAQVGFALSTKELPLPESRVQPLMPLRFVRRGPALAIGDLDGNGRDDLVLGATSAEPLRVGYGRETGRFDVSSGGEAPTGANAEDGPILVFDADGDGANDLLVTKFRLGLRREALESTTRVHLLLNQGSCSFQQAPEGTVPELPIVVGAAAAADFDRSGRLGVFLGGRVVPGRYPVPARSALLANRGGRFEDVTEALAPGLREVGLVTSALWTDVDGDGWLDLLVATEWGQVRYFNNREGRAFVDRTEAAGFATGGTGWWTALAAADFNGDGRMDYVVGNVGLNTQYRASPEQPALLFAGDFGGSGRPPLIEAYYEGDRLVPWRTRKALAAAVPSVLRKFPNNDAYAQASLGEILGEDRLAKARRYAATELRSGVFLSGPDGRFHFEALPHLAQIAPVQGLLAGDFDGDGKADIYAVHNSYAPISVIGRFDGGLSLLLRGDGQGRFTAAAHATSGLVVPGDAKALALVDLGDDGRPDFLVTRNNSTTLAFRNAASDAGRQFVRVNLRGRPGNPTAVGSRITATLADGTIQCAEVYAGQGYYTQSTAACFFGFTEANPLRLLRVRWPDGGETETTVVGGQPVLVLER
jgi:hypothetical protein